MWDILKDIQELGYAVRISPELEETTDAIHIAARASLHGYRIEVHELGPYSRREWIPLGSDQDVLPALRLMARAREDKRKAEQLEREAWEVRRQASAARQREILAAERGKSEMEAIRERQNEH